MKKLFVAAAAALLLGAPAAHAEGWYFSTLGGPSFDPHLSVNGTSADTDIGYNFGLRAGVPLGTATPVSGFSLDADTFFTRSDFKGTDAHESSGSVMADLIYRLDTGTAFDIYGGGGGGLVRTSYDGATSGASSGLGWQALGGVEFNLSPATSLFTEYRYQNTHDVNIGATRVSNLNSDVSFGVKFSM